MRTTQRRLDPALIEQTRKEPECYGFFQLVRLHERIFGRTGQRQAAGLVGESVRFRNSLRMGFAPSQVDALSSQYRKAADGTKTDEVESVEITPSFIGLLGINGTLPIHYTEQVIRQLRVRRDDSGRAFFDLFANRSIAQFYGAWKKYRLPMHYESDRKNGFLPLVLALSGVGFKALRQRLSASPGAFEDESIARFAGLLRQRPMSAEALRRLLAAYFRETVAVEQFVGQWYTVPREQRFVLGGANALLGGNALLGERIWQRNLRLRLRIGSLTHARYIAFLPKGDLSGALSKLLALATGTQFEYEINPVLRAADVRPASLASDGCRLGYDAFLVTRASPVDRAEASYPNSSIH